MTELGIEHLRHPPCSQNLAPCDSWLFPDLKDSPRGNKYECRDEIRQAISGSLRMLARNGLQHVMSYWASTGFSSLTNHALLTSHN